jgi:hypothetical protein
VGVGGWRQLGGVRCMGVGIDGFCGRNEVGIGGFCGINGVGIDGQRTINGVRNDRGGAARSGGLRGVGGRAGRHRHQTVEIIRWYRRRFWTAPTPIRAKWGCELPSRRAAGMRVSTTHDGDSWCQQGARWSRGRPESPHKSTCSSTRRWRCRPARPPTSRNPPLRDAPPRSFRTPLRPQKPPIPTRRSDADRRSPPVCDPTTSDFHLDDPTPSVDSHPSAAPPRSFRTPMIPQNRRSPPRC